MHKNISEANGMWKGDHVGLDALHIWVSKRIVKPKKCEECKKIPPRDLANKGIYNRDLKNWEWLCRKCHMIKDGRLERLRKAKRPIRKPKYSECIVCLKYNRIFSIKMCITCHGRVRYYHNQRYRQTHGRYKNLSMNESIKKVRKIFKLI